MPDNDGPLFAEMIDDGRDVVGDAGRGVRLDPAIGGDGEGLWFLVVERACGPIASLFGGRHRKVGRPGLAAIEDVLSRSERIENLRWLSWDEFRKGGLLPD